MQKIKGFDIRIPSSIFHVMLEIKINGGNPFLVGGAVRDAVISQVHPRLFPNLASKDMDIEVFGMDMEKLLAVLKPLARHVDEVGKRFGVLAFCAKDGALADFSLPRLERKVAAGHGGFEVETDHDLSFELAASRRDFTINTLMFDPFENAVLDTCDGVADIRRRLLRPVSAAFRQDLVIRILRGMQFASRFNMQLAPDVSPSFFSDEVKDWENVTLDNIAKEWLKWASKGLFPEKGIEFLHAANFLHHFPEIAALIGVEQDKEHHPEGDVFSHTLHVLARAGEIARRERLEEAARVRLFFSALAHDFGKPETTAVSDKDGRIHAFGHEEAGVPHWRSFAHRIGLLMPEQEKKSDLVEAVAELVENHMVHGNFRDSSPTPRSIRRMAARMKNTTLAELALLVEADASGRPPLPAGMPLAMQKILEMAKDLNISHQRPVGLIMGRHLIDMGWKPSKKFSLVLNAAFEAQLEGDFSTLEEGIEWVRSNFPA